MTETTQLIFNFQNGVRYSVDIVGENSISLILRPTDGDRCQISLALTSFFLKVVTCCKCVVFEI